MFEGDSWVRTIGLTTPTRKPGRELGTTVKEVEKALTHKRQRTATTAVASGRQMRRQAFPPLLPTEVEPGEAAALIAACPFPFDQTEGLPSDLQAEIDFVATHEADIAGMRADTVKHWQAEAARLKSDSLDLLDAQPECVRGVLLRGREIGQFFHVALFAAML